MPRDKRSHNIRAQSALMSRKEAAEEDSLGVPRNPRLKDVQCPARTVINRSGRSPSLSSSLCIPMDGSRDSRRTHPTIVGAPRRRHDVCRGEAH